MSVTIRRADPRDTAALAGLYRAEVETQQELAGGAFALRPDFAWEAWVASKLASSAVAVFVAEAGSGSSGEVVGFAEARFRGVAPSRERRSWFSRLRSRSKSSGSAQVGPMAPQAAGFLEEIYVLPAWRRQGIGARLVDTAAAWLRDRGAPDVAASIWHANQASQALFARAGFGPSRVVLVREIRRDGRA